MWKANFFKTVEILKSLIFINKYWPISLCLKLFLKKKKKEENKPVWMGLGILEIIFQCKIVVSFCLTTVPTLNIICKYCTKIKYKKLVTRGGPLSHSQRKIAYSIHVAVVEFIFPNNMTMLLPFGPSIIRLSTRKWKFCLLIWLLHFSTIVVVQSLYIPNKVFSLLRL